jgi:hypothetical protein
VAATAVRCLARADGRPWRGADGRDAPAPPAAARGLTPNTVKTHIASIYRKLAVNNRDDAIRSALARGLIPAASQV